MSIYGSSLGPAAYQIAEGSKRRLGATRVTFNGIEAFLTYTSSTQINPLVQYGGRTSDVFPLAEAGPGVFTRSYGSGLGVDGESISA